LDQEAGVDRTTKMRYRAAGREPGLGQLLGNQAMLRCIRWKRAAADLARKRGLVVAIGWSGRGT
jgi:hypothetical protein